jgi:hypothetical protein
LLEWGDNAYTPNNIFNVLATLWVARRPGRKIFSTFLKKYLTNK